MLFKQQQQPKSQPYVQQTPSTPISQPAVQTAKRALRSAGSLSSNKTIAVIIWLFGAWMTVQFLQQVKVPETIAIFVGFALQLALTKAESPIWRSEGLPKMAVGAVVIDIGVNSAGVWPYVKHVGGTDLWTMVKEVAQNPTIEPTVATQLAFAIGVGAYTAAAAEYFWNM